ncbi:MAG: hypothetical protein AAB758_02690 [Patescibacteria group bacterium]
MINHEYQEYLKRQHIKENIFSQALERKENVIRGTWSNSHLVREIVKPVVPKFVEEKEEFSHNHHLIDVMNIARKATCVTLALLLVIMGGIIGIEQIPYHDITAIGQVLEAFTSITSQDIIYIKETSYHYNASVLEGFNNLKDSALDRTR